ncbi:Pyruvate dehydrogenase E1 component subunit beta, mitochondrial [Labeo rohita]|uniref:Pyruvate dehydrogenase E1 component subunit beta, mitochondrial n=1 Tax=Labeo rohita TaxID=84645 RepID=A0ABQ8L0A7_LABRO|nr:Pyruvate dehydrogenase E1 component subunit beta, mitochondrial [Labeo rohita]
MFFFRKCTENNIEQTAVKFEVKVEEQGFPDAEDSDLECIDTEEITSSQETFLFIHQNAQQQELLKRYGDMVLLDATYRTTKYALPLFLLVVRTNVGYKPIAKFICENETTAAITEALNSGISIGNQNSSCLITRNNNTKLWNMYFQILRSIYAHSIVSKLGSDGQGKIKLSPSDQKELLDHLRDIASAPSESSCDREVERLKESKVYKSLEVRNYVDRRWLCVREVEDCTGHRWYRAYAPHGFSVVSRQAQSRDKSMEDKVELVRLQRKVFINIISWPRPLAGRSRENRRPVTVAVTTNNGVEALNKSLKSFYLKFSTTGSLSSLLEMLNAQQQELLKRYGDMVLLDATYRTTKYALPLFLLVVRTNVGYKPIAEFICENETTAAITKALNSGISIGNQNSSCLITHNNNTKLWNMYFQILRSIYAHSIMSKLGSDGQGKLKVSIHAKIKLSPSDQKELLDHLCDIASAPSESSCDREVERLKESKVYKSLEVRNYVDRRTYLYQGNVFVVVFQRWYRAYAPHGFSVAVTTNNGVEALNKSLKSFYLKFSTTGSLSSLLEMLVCEFVPEQLLSYGRLNFIYSSEYKTYKPAVPAFLKEE